MYQLRMDVRMATGWIDGWSDVLCMNGRKEKGYRSGWMEME